MLSLNLTDVPSFEEAFDTESLKNFYKQPEAPHTSRNHAKSMDDSFFDDSISSPDERETQASPLVRYMTRYNQAASDSQLSVNLYQQFFSEVDSISLSSPDSPFELSVDTQEAHQAPSFEKIVPKPIFEIKKAPEIKGHIHFSMSFGNMNMGFQEDPRLVNVNITIPEHFPEPENEESKKFMRLVRAKKIFKIQRDTKPRVSTKLKASPKLKSKASLPPPLPQPLNLSTSVSAPAVQAQNPNLRMMEQFVKGLERKGFNEQQIIKIMMETRGGQSPSQMMFGQLMRQASPPQKF